VGPAADVGPVADAGSVVWRIGGWLERARVRAAGVGRTWDWWRTGPNRETRHLCHHPARPLADHIGGDDRVTASACLRSSQSSQSVTGVTPGGGALRLLWLIRVLRLIRGTGMHWIHHEARIHHANVTEAADEPVAAPGPRLMAHRPQEAGVVAHRPRGEGRRRAGSWTWARREGRARVRAAGVGWGWRRGGVAWRWGCLPRRARHRAGGGDHRPFGIKVCGTGRDGGDQPGPWPRLCSSSARYCSNCAWLAVNRVSPVLGFTVTK
jgi:hypothetical protein